MASAQDKVTDVDPNTIHQAGVLAENTIENVIIGQLEFFDDQVAFNRTCADLVFEDFEDTNVGPSGAVGCPAPFNSSTNNACYSPGDLIPGFSMFADPSFDPTADMVVVTPNAFGFTHVAAGANFIAADNVITFTNTVHGVGLVLVGVIADTTVDVQVFGSGNVFLGSAEVNVIGVDGTFVGVLAQSTITRIELVETGVSLGELVYELSFGTCGFAARPIPTLSEWGLIAMAGVLGIIAILAIRRRKVVI